jgi:hypothetical protein
MLGKLLTGLTVIGGLAAVDASTGAFAQETRKWTDIDCAQSRLVVPSGLKCRATQIYTGARGSRGTSAGGLFQRWSAFGTVNGSKVFYFVTEGSEPSSFTYTSATLLETITSAGAVTKGATQLSELKQVQGGDYATFVRPPGEACFGVRKFGPSQSNGYKWIMYGGRCDLAGHTASAAEVSQFLADVTLRD